MFTDQWFPATDTTLENGRASCHRECLLLAIVGN
jgi:hypothetical protein